MAQKKPVKKAKGEFLMCSAGIRPGDVTARTLCALYKCDSVHMSAEEPSLAMVLRRKGIRVVQAPARVKGPRSRDKIIKSVLKDLMSGMNTALMTYGHPVFLSSSWDGILPLLRANGIKYTVEEGVSSLDRLLSAVGLFSIPGAGISIKSVLSCGHADISCADGAALLLMDAGALRQPRNRAFAKVLFGGISDRLGAGHACWAVEVPCFQDPAGKMTRFLPGDYRSALKSFNERTTLYVPAARH